MITFVCPGCAQLVFFDNTACLRCGLELALDSRRAMIAATRTCANRAAGCNWSVEDGSGQCRSCRSTRTLPPLDDAEIHAKWASVEAAKRRLLFQLEGLELDATGVTFDLLSSAEEPVVTGHADGVITLDLAEADDVARVRMRAYLGEPYRTVLGHFRHEIGHYFWSTLIDQAGRHEEFRAVFGDERDDYGAALERHYARASDDAWSGRYVSYYASAHPWEDFAETMAHYLHITDVMETAGAYGIQVEGPSPVLQADPADVDREADTFAEILSDWLPLTYALNATNRAMGVADLYPFVLAPAAIEKLAYVHRLVQRASAG